MMTKAQMKEILNLRTTLDEFVTSDDFVDAVGSVLLPAITASPVVSDELKIFLINEMNNHNDEIVAEQFYDHNNQKTVASSALKHDIENYALYDTHHVAYDMSDVIATPVKGVLINPTAQHEVIYIPDDNILLFDSHLYNAIYSMGRKGFMEIFDSSEVEALNRIYKALIVDYSPIENVDEYEYITDTRTPSLTEEISQTESSTRTPSLTEAVTQTESTTRTPSLTEAVTQTESSTRTPNLTESVTHGGEDTEIPNITETTEYHSTEHPQSTESTGDSGYNSSVAYENHRVVSGGSVAKTGSDSVKQSGRKTIKHGGHDENVTSGNEITNGNTYSNKQMTGHEDTVDTLHSSRTQLGNEKNDVRFNQSHTTQGTDENVHEKRRHGNIGVTTNCQLIEAELKLRKNNFYALMMEMVAQKLFSKLYR